jgi:hypothetical protein
MWSGSSFAIHMPRHANKPNTNITIIDPMCFIESDYREFTMKKYFLPSKNRPFGRLLQSFDSGVRREIGQSALQILRAYRFSLRLFAARQFDRERLFSFKPSYRIREASIHASSHLCLLSPIKQSARCKNWFFRFSHKKKIFVCVTS